MRNKNPRNLKIILVLKKNNRKKICSFIHQDLGQSYLSSTDADQWNR